MNPEAPTIARRIFTRLCKGDNLLLSRNGAGDDADLFIRLEAEEEACRAYFEVLGFQLKKGDNYYHFAAEDEPQINVENKLERVIRLVKLLDFLSSRVDSFGEGQIFSASVLAGRCNGDPRAERFLEEAAKGSNYAERLEQLLQTLVRQGYLSEYDASRKEYRVLSAINYLFEFADRIAIASEEDKEGQ